MRFSATKHSGKKLRKKERNCNMTKFPDKILLFQDKEKGTKNEIHGQQATYCR